MVDATVTMLIPSIGRDKQALIRELLTSQLSQVIRGIDGKVDWFQRLGSNSQVATDVEQPTSLVTKSTEISPDVKRPPRPTQ